MACEGLGHLFFDLVMGQKEKNLGNWPLLFLFGGFCQTVVFVLFVRFLFHQTVLLRYFDPQPISCEKVLTPQSTNSFSFLLVDQKPIGQRNIVAGL